MTKARKKAIDDMKNRKGANNTDDRRWWWKLRGYSELTYYWINAFNFPIVLLIWVVTGDYWKALGFLFVTQLYNVSQNLRGLFLRIEQLIEYTINKTI